MSSLLSAGDLSGLPGEGLVVVGFSAGADSTALAHWLSTRIDKSRLLLCHINHGLRGEEADRDEAAAREFAGEHGLRFVVFREKVAETAKEMGMGLEECGRMVRYGHFNELAQGDNDRILTAHNADDNAETLLLNLSRGTGLLGLCGIPYSRGKILRPLLGVSRREIEEYCRENGLSYVTDSTNLSEEYTRNRLRHQVLPVLKEQNPRFLQAVNKTVDLLREDNDYLEEEGGKLLERARCKYGVKTAPLLAAARPLQTRALRRYLKEAGCENPEGKHIALLCKVMKQGGGLSLPGGLQAACAQGVLSLASTEEAGGGEEFSLEVGVGETLLPNGKKLILRVEQVDFEETGGKIYNSFFKNALDYDIITGNLVARTRLPGDCMIPAGEGHTKSLKKLFQENRVPAAGRKAMVLLQCGGEPAFCEGVGPSRRFCITEKTKRALVITITGA